MPRLQGGRRLALGLGVFLAGLMVADLPAWGLSEAPPPGAEISVRFAFDPGDLSFTDLNGYPLVQIPGGVLPDDPPGTPWLPARFVNILLPAGATVMAIRTEAVEEVVREDILICPAQPPHPSSEAPATFVPPDPAAYASATAVPSVLAEYGQTHRMRGYTFASLRLNPVRYLAALRSLSLATELTVTVSYVNADQAPATPPQHTDFFRRAVDRLVVNPDQEAAAPAVGPGPSAQLDGDAPLDMVEYLIITSDTLAPHFQSLADHRASHNALTTGVLTTSEIYAAYPGDRPSGGTDNQTRIRNCIIDYVQNHGTLYVVLGGDDGIVPDRDTYVTCGSYSESDMPTDLYYSGLDGTWDGDADGTYGEAQQDTDVDLAPDVIVGRIPVASTTDADAYINKLIAYETGPTASAVAMKMLQCGHKLWNRYSAGDSGYPSDAEFQDRVPYGGSVSDAEIWMVRNYRVYIEPYWVPTTHGELYDTASTWDSTPKRGDYAESPSHLVDRFNEGWAHVMYDTHGGSGIWAAEGGNFGKSQASSLTGIQGIIQTGACLTGHFDGTTSLSEAFIRNGNGGALVYLGCSRYGWGSPGSTYGGTSWRYMRSFYSQVFEEGHSDAGEAFMLSKVDLASSSTWNGSTRWVQFGLNYQGDPAVHIYGLMPQVWIEATDPLAAEPGTDTGSVTIWREDTVGNLTVNYSVGGTAAPDDDYAAFTGQTTIPNGEDHVALLIVPTDDDVAEGDETIEVTLASGDGYEVGAPGVASVTLVDDDNAALPTVGIEPVDALLSEPGDGGAVRLIRTGSVDGNLAVALTFGGAATHDADYTAPVVVTMAGGETTLDVSVAVLDDTLVEPTEALHIGIEPAPAYIVGYPDDADLEIADDEPRHILTVVATDPDASEIGPDDGAFTVFRTGDTTLPLIVPCSYNGTATPVSDYQSLPGSVTIPAGAASAPVPVVVKEDDLAEGDETVVLNLTLPLAGAAYTVGTPASDAVTIADSECILSITVDDAVIAERGQAETILTVSRVGHLADPLTVYYAVEGTATPDADYEALLGTVTLQAEAASATMVLRALNDAEHEAAETVVVTLSAHASYGIDSRASSITVSIADDDNDAPMVTVTSPEDGAFFETGADVPIAVTATDADGIGRVEFYADGEKIAEDDSAPYEALWPHVAGGSHSLTARAVDGLGLWGDATPVGVSAGLGPLPPPWQHSDVGAVSADGDAGYANATDTFTVIGSGNDIWSAADEFHYVYQPVTGDGYIIARVLTIDHTNDWAKGGVMIRETLDSGSKHAMAVATPSKGIAFQRRTSADSSSSHTGVSGAAPEWVKLVREGDTLTGYRSEDGQAWAEIASATVPMGQTVYAGLAVTAHDDGELCAATFDNVTVDFNEPPTVAITEPADGAIVAAGAAVVVRAIASDSDGQVVRVELRVDGGPLGEVTAPPFEATWTDVALGLHTLTATAWDDDGEFTVADPVTVTVAKGGDANLDGEVDPTDYFILSGNWFNGTGPFTWADGDFNGDGLVNTADYFIMTQNWTREPYVWTGTETDDPAGGPSTEADAASEPAVQPLTLAAKPPRLVACGPEPGARAPAVRTLVLEFDGRVTVDADAVKVYGPGGPVVVSGLRTDASGCIFYVSLRGMPAEGLVEVRVRSDGVRSAETGVHLDGEVADPLEPLCLPSGDGEPGGDARYEFDVVGRSRTCDSE